MFNAVLERDGVQTYAPGVALLARLGEHGIRRAVVSASRNCRRILAAAGLSEAVERHGRHSVYAVASGRAPHEAAYMVQRFMRAGLGSNYVDNCSRA